MTTELRKDIYSKKKEAGYLHTELDPETAKRVMAVVSRTKNETGLRISPAKAVALVMFEYEKRSRIAA